MEDRWLEGVLLNFGIIYTYFKLNGALTTRHTFEADFYWMGYVHFTTPLNEWQQRRTMNKFPPSPLGSGVTPIASSCCSAPSIAPAPCCQQRQWPWRRRRDDVNSKLGHVSLPPRKCHFAFDAKPEGNLCNLFWHWWATDGAEDWVGSRWTATLHRLLTARWWEMVVLVRCGTLDCSVFVTGI